MPIFLAWGSWDGQSQVEQTNMVLDSAHSAGQTFTAHQAGLNGIDLFLHVYQAGGGKILLEVRSSLNSFPEVLRQSTLQVDQITQDGIYHFPFAPLDDSCREDYYVQMVMDGGSLVGIGQANSRTYLDGSAYQNQVPVDSQLMFRLNYSTSRLAAGMLAEEAGWLVKLAAASFLFILPGLALLGRLWPGDTGLNNLDRLGLGVGVGLAANALLFLWTNLVGIHLGLWYALLPGTLALLYGLFKIWNGWRRLPKLFDKTRKLNFQLTFPGIALALALLLVFMIRFYATRTIDFPMWGDSYQHTLIVQLMLDNKGLFSAWQPYADLQSMTYHFGFHAATAVFAWMNNLPAARAVLDFGQILNGMAVLALIPLLRLFGKRSVWSAPLAVLVAGLVSALPMEFTNWGRYTQLAGQVILPAVIWISWTIQLAGKISRRQTVLSAILWAGLALTHYRELVFAAAIFAPLILDGILQRRAWQTVRLVLIQAAAGLGLFLPWLVNLASGRLPEYLAAKLTPQAGPISGFSLEANTIEPLTRYLPVSIWLAAAVALLIGVKLNRRASLILVGWWLVIVAAANPAWVGLPGTGLLSNFAVVITAYLPAALLAGFAGGWCLEVGVEKFRWVRPVFFAIFLAACLWFGVSRPQDLGIREHALVTRADIRAGDWLRDNAEPGSIVLVNNFFAFGGNSIVGSDAGWWIPYTSGHSTNLPPLTYTSEKSGKGDYIAWVNQLSKVLFEKGLASPEAKALLKERKITYLFIGQQNGSVNGSKPPLLQPAELAKNDSFRPVYHQDRVWIYKLVPENEK